MSKKTAEETKLEQAVAAEFSAVAKKVTRYSEQEVEAGRSEVCVFSKKLGLFVCYQPLPHENENGGE